MEQPLYERKHQPEQQQDDQKYDLVCTPAQAHDKIIWLDVSVQKAFRMNIFYSVDLVEIARGHKM